VQIDVRHLNLAVGLWSLKNKCNKIYSSPQRRLILDRLFKAGTFSASGSESRQRRLILQIGANRRCRD